MRNKNYFPWVLIKTNESKPIPIVSKEVMEKAAEAAESLSAEHLTSTVRQLCDDMGISYKDAPGAHTLQGQPISQQEMVDIVHQELLGVEIENTCAFCGEPAENIISINDAGEGKPVCDKCLCNMLGIPYEEDTPCKNTSLSKSKNRQSQVV